MRTNLYSSLFKHTVRLLLLLLITCWSGNAFSQTVTVTTDKDDYYPCQWVIITGTGWGSDDSVKMDLTHVGTSIPDHSHDSWYIKPDASGNIYYEWYVLEQELGTAFELTALGMSTGFMAETYFTDAAKPTTTTVSSSANPSSYGDSILFTASVTNSGNVNCGTVTFKDGSVALGTTDVSAGTARLKISTLTTGTHSITAIFTPSANGCNYQTSTSSILSQVVSCTAPSFTSCPGNQSVNTATGLCSAVVSYSTVATGSPAPTYAYAFTGATTGSGNGTGSGTGSGATFNKGITNVSITATNSCGTATCSFTVTVTDKEKPVISTNGNKNVNTDDGVCGASVTVSATASDNCSVGLPTGTRSDGLALTAPFPVGTTTITWTVTDANGNAADTVFQTVKVSDNTPPVAKCKNITIQLDASGNASIVAADIDNGSNDACGIDSLIISKSSFDCSNVGENTVSLKVVDKNGNVATCNAVVTVQDTIAPVVSCKNITVQLDSTGNISVKPEDIINDTSDACGIDSLNISQTSFDCSNVGKNNVTLTATDKNGNTATYNAVVTVQDNIAPIAKSKNITIQLDASGNASINAGDINNGSYDACGIDSLKVYPNSFDCSSVGDNIVTMTVIDKNGNRSTSNAVVTVQDTVAPVANCKNISVQLDANGNASIVAADIDGGSTDACGITSRSASKTDFDCSNIGANNVTLMVTDKNGNTDTCNAIVTIAQRATTVTNLGVFSGQYSDSVTLAASLTDQVSGNPLADKTITFTLGNISASAKTNASGIASVKVLLNLNPNNSYKVKAEYTGACPYLGNSDEDAFAVNCENASVTYNGGTYFTANPNSGTGTITLSAYVMEIADNSAGDIRNASVTFHEGSLLGNTLGTPNLPVGLINPLVTTQGTASTDYSYTLKSTDISSGGKTWEVYTTVNNYYCATSDTIAVVTLAMPGTDYVTGGGNIILPTATSGTYPAAARTKMNFGFVMKWNKSGKNLQGNIIIIYRGKDRINYQIKSNAINSLAVEYVDNSGKVVSSSSATFKRATISTKANLNQLNPDGTSISLGGNLSLTITAWESLTDKTGASDRISVQLAGANGSGIYFSSNWTGGTTSWTQLSGGKIQVQSGNSSALKSISVSEAADAQTVDATPVVKVYPNPFVNKVFITLQWPNDTRALMEIFDFKGMKLATIFDNKVNAGQPYILEYTPQNVSSGMLIYRLVIDGQVFNGKLIYNK